MRFVPLMLIAALAHAVPVVVRKSGPLRTQTVTLPPVKAAEVYSFLFSVDSPRAFDADSRLAVRLEQGGDPLVSKTLHLGDPDLYAAFQVRRPGPAQIRMELNRAVQGVFSLQINRLPAAGIIEREPNNRWQDANPIALGATVFASADDTPYTPLPGTRPKESLDGEQGIDWFRFSFDGPPKLVFFQIDLMERDNIPVDVSVYRVIDGKPVAFNDGEDPVTLPHEVQALPGNKFTTRILKDPGDYYIRVRAAHPEYKLRTRVYDPPPYGDPRRAVRAALDFLLGAGDSWHANTPRRGGVFDRVANVHQETSLCVACHPTHFTQRAALYAARNGYPVVQRQQLQFLSERFYNNPRPFYGFEREGAVWARVISASANVLSRMSVLLDLFETEISGHRRDRFHQGVAEYLKLYYKDRDKLPPDETNGNTPLVSAYEVAWYSWKVTQDPRIAALLDQDAIKNLVDLCYQTLALADIDRARHAEKIRRNAGRILSLQRPSGQWSMRFEPDQAEVEFQTGHALWALQAAGVPKDHPGVARAIEYLLKRQQPFGGWMDPLQSFENFRTPFRETQMAVLALSSYFPEPRREKGWNTASPARLSSDPAELLTQLDNLWDRPSNEVVEQLIECARSNETLVRQQAIEALGRVAPEKYVALYSPGLGDPSKLVQRTAAWATRQHYSRNDTGLLGPLLAALEGTDRVRWGATRVFATHASGLALRPSYAKWLARLAGDPIPTVQMQALKGLWQYWFWTGDEGSKELIEDAFLAAMAKPQHPWVERNLREGVYNLADENIRYFYNNWIPLLARPEDRKRAIQGRLAVEARLARKFADVLEKGSDLQRKTLLAGLADFELRRGDVYDLNADLTRAAPLVYSRIGNDVEPIVFFGESNERLARALLPLLSSQDDEMRRLASRAAPLVREVRFPGVNDEAGPTGPTQKLVVPVSAASSRPARTATRPATKYGRPDEAYFRGYVQPILETRGKDGYACVHCHATHTLFDGTYSTILNVVDRNDPEDSLLLRKPVSSAESEGIAGSKQLSHGGGVRWDKGSPQYQTILDWIKGAK
ncbi:MAG: HEAT repeat domain-containing protein [Candidatus Solibacter usitatus]|nr:HEAT repeat domain-containing protein [Candidatus Solibacter usitatus]